jgi:uncharacterized membrane protein
MFWQWGLVLVAASWLLRAVLGIRRDALRQQQKSPAIPASWSILGVLMTWGLEGVVFGFAGILVTRLWIRSPLAQSIFIAIVLGSVLLIVYGFVMGALVAKRGMTPTQKAQQEERYQEFVRQRRAERGEIDPE